MSSSLGHSKPTPSLLGIPLELRLMILPLVDEPLKMRIPATVHRLDTISQVVIRKDPKDTSAMEAKALIKISAVCRQLHAEAERFFLHGDGLRSHLISNYLFCFPTTMDHKRFVFHLGFQDTRIIGAQKIRIYSYEYLFLPMEQIDVPDQREVVVYNSGLMIDRYYKAWGLWNQRYVENKGDLGKNSGWEMERWVPQHGEGTSDWFDCTPLPKERASLGHACRYYRKGEVEDCLEQYP